MAKNSIQTKNIAEACENYAKIFGANKNLYRITISMQDGLKPVARRFIYSLYNGKGRNQFIKMQKASADTMASYHPHGGTSIAEVGANMASPIANNVCCVEGQGNFGSYKSAKAGAERYIECRLSKYAYKCFFEDFKNSNVDMKLAYTGDDYEPEALPSRYPHALFNPQLSGIGYGMASNVPSFNVKEVLEATISLLKNPKSKVFLIPDMPTGADIVDNGMLQQINDDGTGKLVLRGSIEVNELENTITITSIPLQITIDDIIRNIVELKEKKVFEEIKEIKDYTNNEKGVKTIIYLNPSADPYKTVEKLYKKNTGLQKTYPIGMKMIDDYEPYDFGVKSFLLYWIDYRRDVVRSSFNTALVKAMEEQNINDVLVMISTPANGKRTINILTSSNKSEIAKKLMDEYGINSQQANTIANMRASSFCRDAHKEYVEKQEELKAEIARLEDILDNDEKIDETIIEQLQEGIKLFGKPRKSKVVKDNDDTVEIPDTEHIVAVSPDGYIKKVPLKTNKIGQVGNTNSQYMTAYINNRDTILVFDNMGGVARIPISSVPDMKLKDTGLPLERYSKVKSNIVSVLVEPSEQEIKKKGKELFLVFLTKQGYVKRTLVSEFTHINGYGTAAKIPNNDELVAVDYVTEDTVKDMVMYTNLGNGIRRDINEFNIMKPNARGFRQITLDNEEEFCVGFDKIDPNKKYMFYITSAGRVKLTEMKYFPTMKKNDNILSLINLEKNEKLVGIHTVNRDDKIIVYKKHSEPEVINLKDIAISTRVAKGEKVIKTKGDAVLSYGVIV